MPAMVAWATAQVNHRAKDTRLGSRVHRQEGCLLPRWRRASQRASDGGILAASVDPYFIKSLAMEETIKTMKTAVGWLVADGARRFYLSYGVKTEKLCADGVQAMRANLDANRYRPLGTYQSGWDAWNRSYASSAASLLREFDAANKLVMRQITTVLPLATDETKLPLQHIQEVSKQYSDLVPPLLSPSGTLADYEREFTQFETKTIQSVNQFDSAQPSLLKALTRCLETSGSLRSGQTLYKKPEETPKALERHKNLFTEA
jgi:hypothetical protein